VIHGEYRYTAQLLELDSCRLQGLGGLSPAMSHIHTPTKVKVWKQELAGHPDQQFAGFIVQGLSTGYWVGFQHQSSCLRQVTGNMRISEPQVVSDYIREELQAGRLVQISEMEAAAWNVHCSPIFPKA